MAQNEWIYDSNYKSWFYLKSDGAYAHQEWQLIGNKWYYFKKWGYMAKSQWQGSYFLNGQGAMMQNEWLYDPAYSAYFYLKSDGTYANQEWQKWAANGTISRSGAIWLGMSGKATTI